MYTPDFESRILQRALFRGLLSAADLDQIRPESGSRLEALIQAGLLDPKQVQVLSFEVAELPAFTLPSWPVDSEEPDSPAAPPVAWKGYTELQPIGMGGGGMVYRARDPQLNRWVALKFPRTDQPWRYRRMLREAQAQARVDHPNIVKVYEVGEYQGQPFIAMQLIRGTGLQDVVVRLTLKQKVRLMVQIAEGLHAAHQLGLIHLDIKPSNILVEITDRGEPRPFLADFGLVLEEDQETRVIGAGTPAFASPEQLAGDLEHLDRRSDIYSLGATLHFLLTGVPPFQPRDHETNWDERFPSKAWLARTPMDLKSITDRCLRSSPSDRYENCQELADDLQRFLTCNPVVARSQTAGYRMTKWLQRNRLLISILASAGALLLGLGLWHFRTTRQAANQTYLAVRYGQEIQTIEEVLRTAYLSRIHDIRPALDQVRTMMKRIQEDMNQLGPDALGPGSYAIGAGYFALGETSTAQSYMDRAWMAGFRTAACAKTRGLVLAELYKQAKSEIRADDPVTRQEHLLQLQKSLRDPAIECFQLARNQSAPVPNQEAVDAHLKSLDAYLREDLEGAILCTEEAGHRTPWYYETDLLRHDLHMELAANARADGNLDEAKKHLESAGKDLIRILEVAPSNPWVWTNKGYWCMKMSDLPGLSPQAQQAWVNQGVQAYKTALSVDPDHVETYGCLVDAYNLLAAFARSRHQDPIPFLELGVQCGEAGFQKQPTDRTHVELGWSLIWLGQEQLLQGQDARENLNRALVGFREGAKTGGDYDVMKGLHTSLYLIGQCAAIRGEDPRPYFQEAIEWAKAAYKVEFNNALRRAEAISYRVDIAESEIRLGRSPEDDLNHLVDELASAAQKLSGEPRIQRYYGRALRVRAEWKFLSNQDPRADFNACVRPMKRAIVLGPNDPMGHRAMAEWALAYGSWLVSQGVSSDFILQQGIQASRTYRRLEPWGDYPRALEMALEVLLHQSHSRWQEASELSLRLHHLRERNAYIARFLICPDDNRSLPRHSGNS